MGAAKTRTDRLVLGALIAGALALTIFTVWLQWFWADNSMDIDVYWEAGRRMLNGGANLYGESEDPANNVGLFIYPPLFATLFAPLTVLPREVGYAAWGFIQLALVGVSFRCIRGLCNVQRSEATAFYLLIGIALFGALWTNLTEGQVNLLVVSTVAGGVWLIESGRWKSGAVLLAVATHLKIIPIVLLPLLIAQKRFKAAAAMGAWIIVLWLAPLVYSVPNYGLIDGWNSNVQLSGDYASQIIGPRMEKGRAYDLGGVRAPNNAINAVAHRWFADDYRLSLRSDERSPLATVLPEFITRYAGLVIGAILGGLAMLLAWWRRNSRAARVASMGLGLLAAALANFLFWPHHICLLLLVVGPLAASGIHRKDMRPALAATATLLLFAYAPLIDTVPVFDGMAIWGTPTAAILVVWALALIHFLRCPIEEPPAGPILRAHEEENTGNPDA